METHIYSILVSSSKNYLDGYYLYLYVYVCVHRYLYLYPVPYMYPYLCISGS